MSSKRTPQQVRILTVLERHGELSGAEIAAIGEIPRGSIYVHLGLMADAGLIASRAMPDDTTTGPPRRLWRKA